MGQEYLISYENLFLDFIFVKDEGPLQGYFQIKIIYNNLNTDGQTSLILTLERLNFFLDLNGDQCQTWIAEYIDNIFYLLDIDDLICSFNPISNIDWVKKHPEFDRYYGVNNFRFIPFSEFRTESDTILSWGIKESLIFALKYDEIVYWDCNITLDFCLLFHLTVKNNIAYLEYEIYIENCSINEWIQIIYGFLSINLGLEWNTEVSVIKGLTCSSAFWSLDDLYFDCTTAINITIGKIVEDNIVTGKLNLGTTYIKNKDTVLPLFTSAISLQDHNNANDKSTQLRYSQTIFDYTAENISLSSQFEFYYDSNTLNIIFIIFFNLIFSIIILKKRLQLKRKDNL